jgi:hypothetical protein
MEIARSVGRGKMLIGVACQPWRPKQMDPSGVPQNDGGLSRNEDVPCRRVSDRGIGYRMWYSMPSARAAAWRFGPTSWRETAMAASSRLAAARASTMAAESL